MAYKSHLRKRGNTLNTTNTCTLASYVTGHNGMRGIPSGLNPFRCRQQASMAPQFAGNRRGIVSRTNRCSTTYQHRGYLKGSYSYSTDLKTGDISYASDTTAAFKGLYGARKFARDMGSLVRAAYLGAPFEIPATMFQPWIE